MRVVFNYRKALREPKKIRELAPGVYSPISFELIPTINWFMFLAITFYVGLHIRKVYPYAFEDTWAILLFGIPTLLTTLVKKIEPEGKNIYIFIYDFIKFFITIKLPNKQFINDRRVAFASDKKVTFKKCVEVVNNRNGEVETSIKDNKKQFTLNKRGRRVGVLSNQEQVDSDSKQKSG